MVLWNCIPGRPSAQVDADNFIGSRRLDESTPKLDNLSLGVVDRRVAQTSDDSKLEKRTPTHICSLAIASILNESNTDQLTLDPKERMEGKNPFFCRRARNRSHNDPMGCETVIATPSIS
jgi:hypothetical protein